MLANPVANDFPDADVHTAPLGIFGKRVKDDDTVLRDGDPHRKCFTARSLPTLARKTRESANADVAEKEKEAS